MPSGNMRLLMTARPAHAQQAEKHKKKKKAMRKSSAQAQGGKQVLTSMAEGMGESHSLTNLGSEDEDEDEDEEVELEIDAYTNGEDHRVLKRSNTQSRSASHTAFKSIGDVAVSMRVRRVTNVETAEQKFLCLIHLIFSWELPAWENEPTAQHSANHDWVPGWRPSFRIKNVLVVYSQEETFSYSRVPTEDGYDRRVVGEYHIGCEIFEAFNLKYFPTDVQVLTVEIEMKHDIKEASLVPFDDGTPLGDVLLDRCFLSDFRFINKKNYLPYSVLYSTSDRQSSRRGLCFPRVTVRIFVQRNAEYFLKNIVANLMSFCGLSLTAWAYAPTYIAERHTIGFTLILTTVALKISVVTSLVPMTPYQTLLDHYSTMCTTFIILCTVYHGVAPYVIGLRYDEYNYAEQFHVEDDSKLWPVSLTVLKDLNEFDVYVGYAASAILVVSNLIWAVAFMWISVKHREDTLATNDGLFVADPKVAGADPPPPWSRAFNSLVRKTQKGRSAYKLKEAVSVFRNLKSLKLSAAEQPAGDE